MMVVHTKIHKDAAGNSIEYLDSIYYPGTKEYGVTLRVNGQIKKETIKEKDFHEYLKKFQMDSTNKNQKDVVKEELVETIKSVRQGTLDPNKAIAISKVANAYTSLLKVEAMNKKQV